MDKYKSQAPHDKYRYKTRKGTCCYSRVGTVKVSFSSKEKAEATGLEGYPCRVHEGKWHGRKKR